MEPDLVEIRAILERTPVAIRGLLSGLPDPWLSANEGPDTFSPRDVVGHLIHAEKTDWIPRTRIILKDGEARAFDPFDRTAFADAVHGATIEGLLSEFDELRSESLRILDGFSITRDQLALKGRHPGLGAVTLGQLLATWAVHDLNHIGQIVRVMSRRYDTTVGPWKAYLGILNR
jgi:DinB superfamily